MNLKKMIGIMSALALPLEVLGANNYPLCANNEVEDYMVVNSSMAMKMCYTSPSTMKVKIKSISLVKQDGSEVSFYAPASPEYVDLNQGLSDLAQNVTPVSGTYSALKIDMDATWKITASSDYTPAGGSTQYCRTQQNAGTFQSTNWSMDVHTQKLADSNITAVETNYLHNAFSFVSTSGAAAASEPQNDSAYFSKNTYTINAGGILTIEHYLVNSTGTVERTANSVTGEVIKVNFSTPIEINQETDATYTLSFDLSKAIGFGHEYEMNGNISYRNNGCAYMTIGPLPVTLSVESNAVSSAP